MSHPASQQRACACSAVKRWFLAMLHNRAKTPSSPRGCGAANALLTACARYGIWEGEAGAKKRRSQPNKETDLQEKEDVRICDAITDEKWSSPGFATVLMRICAAIDWAVVWSK